MRPGRPSDAWRLLLSACAGVFLLFSYFGQKTTPSLLLVDLTHFVLMLASGVFLALPATRRKACAFLVAGPLAIALCFLAGGDLLGGHEDEFPLLLRPAVLFTLAPVLVLVICRLLSRAHRRESAGEP
jgi:hypothetical protein